MSEKTETIELNIDDIIKSDYILNFLTKTLGLNFITVSLVSVFISSLIIPWAINTNVWSGIDYPLQVSLHTWIGDILLGVCNGCILFYYQSIPKAFNQIIQTKVITSGSVDTKTFIKTTIHYYRKGNRFLPYIFSMVVTLSMHYLYITDKKYGWTETGADTMFSPLGFYHMIYFFGEFSIFLIVFIKFYKTAKILRLLEQHVNKGFLNYNFVRLCKNNAGGLAPLGRLTSHFFYILAILGGYVSIMAFSTIKFMLNFKNYDDIWVYFESVIPLTVYISLVIFCFLYSLMPIHRMMKKKKEMILSEIIKHDMETFKFEPKSMVQAFNCDIKRKQLIEYTQAFIQCQSYPSWPFNTRTISTTISAVLLPLIPSAFKVALFFSPK